jgi:TonB family protein
VSAPLASESDLGLVFVWEHPRRRRLAIAGFVGASVLMHALCFYVFQIIYPPAVALLPPPGRITVIAPNTEEGRVLLRWLEAEDPALASTTQPPADGKSLALPTIQHAPSYLARQPALRDIPPSPPDPAVPSAQPPAPVEPPHPPMQMAPKIASTLVRWSPELETRGALQRPEMKFTASGRESPQAAQFRVAVDENGAVRYCFVEKSSGDPALDEQARKYLTLSRFSPIENRKSKIENAFTWGTATVEWGNDIVAPSPAAESVAP